MIVFVCVDDRFGMLFNQRRQSSDRAVVEKMIEISAGKRLWVASYSSILFPESVPICKDEDFLQKASSGDFCFVESHDIGKYLDRAEKIVIFQWNRTYPADLYFPKAVLDCGWKLVETADFAGFSHERITMKVYKQ